MAQKLFPWLGMELSGKQGPVDEEGRPRNKNDDAQKKADDDSLESSNAVPMT